MERRKRWRDMLGALDTLVLPRTRRLTSQKHTDMILAAADLLHAASEGDMDVLLAAQEFVTAADEEAEAKAPPGQKVAPVYSSCTKLAIKLAQSRAQMLRLAARRLHLTVVCAMYGEQNRMLPSSRHEHGEDFIAVKVQELRWALRGTQTTFDVLLVDDGCDNDSGGCARARVKELGLQETVRVMFLQDCIDQGADKWPMVSGVKQTSDSRKGGSIQAGLWSALRRGAPVGAEHLLLYSDCDLSTHLGQIGLLVAPLCDEAQVQLAMGSRYDRGGVIDPGPPPQPKEGEEKEKAPAGLKDPSVWRFVMLRDWVRKHILPPLAPVRDSQCGFKLFRAAALRDALPRMTDRVFTFDIELIILVSAFAHRTQQLLPAQMLRVATVAWIDSVAEATSRAGGTHLAHLKSLCKLHATYKSTFEHLLTPLSLQIVEWVRGTELPAFSKLMNDTWDPHVVDHRPGRRGKKLDFGCELSLADLRKAIAAKPSSKL